VDLWTDLPINAELRDWRRPGTLFVRLSAEGAVYIEDKDWE
jgi:hypothetical protein